MAKPEVLALEDRCLLSFGAGGLVLTDLRNGWDSAEAVAIQPGTQPTDASKIMAGGRTYNNQGTYKFALARYNLADGSLDSAFGNNGTVVTTLDSKTKSFLHAVAVQQDRKAVAGFTPDGM